MAAKKKTSKKTSKKKVTRKALPLKKKKVARKKVTTKKTLKKKVTTKKEVIKKKGSKKTVAKKKKSTPKSKKKTVAKKQAVKKTIIKKKKKKGMAKVTDIKTKSSKTVKATKKSKVSPYEEKKGEEYMGEKQTAHFRHLLNAWRQDLMEEVDRTVHHMQDEAANFPDPNDRATQEEEFSIELRTRDRERKLIRKIEEGILSLDSGDYGFCEVCGVEIGIRRLEARPTATLCIDCKTLDEIKERQLG